ncbi:unnamed protein product [Rotaria magnacalcarata]|uniref:J domain-containing protein n=1 Tax=Rotaria magnacalcarata TaxID=392030 RepID=A0A816QIX8_9BILA|nr:unnamed protein product [Rotaria magnacalcarata]
MAGMKFEYDENGGKFFYFFLSVYALILVPATYWLWPKSEKKQSLHPENISSYPPCRDKYHLLRASEPRRRRRTIFVKIALLTAWIILLILAYRASLIETEHKEYDPFMTLDVDQGASISEIKRAYRELSKKHHPDRGGDPEKFANIAKAYKTLTDEESKNNWKTYGNPDGPGVTHFGIALPKWLVDHKNSLFVLLIYTGVFMIVLPVIICIWWQKSARYAGDHILIDTIRLYHYFLRKTALISIKRSLLILSASAEFDRRRNPMIVDRPSDNIELPELFRELTNVQEKIKEIPFQDLYSIKARTLLYAHLHRLDSLSDNLVKDKQYIVRRSINLINEIINMAVQLVNMQHNQQIEIGPKLETIENTMKLSPMLVQALLNTKSPFLQLPHITENHLRFFETKKRTIKHIRQFAAIGDEQRRSMLRSITDEQYNDIMNVLAIYPHVTMTVSFGVADDDDEHIITTVAVVTLTVRLHRQNMSSLFSKELAINSSALTNKTLNDERNEEQINDKENREKTNETLKVLATTTTSSKGWNNKSEKKKKANKDKGKKKGHPKSSTKTTNKQTTVNTNNNQKKKIKNDNKNSSDDDSSKHSDDLPTNSGQRHEQAKEDLNETDNESNNNINNDNDDDNNENIPNNSAPEQSQSLISSNKTKTPDDDKDDDVFLERFQQQQRKREKLETKAKISHRVFCPFYPEIKQECWWLYVADRKQHALISAPIYLCNLKDDDEIEVKFSAPKLLGHYVYTVILRSDSYFDADVTENFSFNVQTAKKVADNHPQWDFSEDDGATNNKADDDEFATESDSDKD